MQAEQYRAIAAWFNAHPTAKKAFRLFCVGSVAAVYAAYAVLLAVLAWQHSEKLPGVFGVPAFVLVSGTALRATLNSPRPYEKLDFTPLFPKDTTGKSMPSRHCFSAAAIAVAAFTVSPPLGTLLAMLALGIAGSRVVSGVHFPADVLAGLCYGAAISFVGFRILGIM